MERDMQALQLLNRASDMLEAQGDFLAVAQLSHPIATIEARLAKNRSADVCSDEGVARTGSAASR